METVKYRCKACNFSERLTKKDFIFFFFNRFFFIIGIVTFIIILFSYVYLNTNIATFMINNLASIGYTKFAIEHDNELRDVALNLTSNCRGDYPECYVKTLYNKLISLRYVPNSKYKILYSPEYVYENGGDCKNMASMFVSLIRSLGFNAEVICNIDKQHCVSKIPLKKTYDTYYNKYIIVDLVMSEYIIVDKSEDFWNYYD